MSILFICVPSSSLGRDTVMQQVAASTLFRFTPQIGANMDVHGIRQDYSVSKSSQRRQLIGNELVFDHIESTTIQDSA